MLDGVKPGLPVQLNSASMLQEDTTMAWHGTRGQHADAETIQTTRHYYTHTGIAY